MKDVTITIVNDGIDYTVSLGDCSWMELQNIVEAIEDILQPFKYYDKLIINNTEINPKTLENDLLIFLGQN